MLHYHLIIIKTASTLGNRKRAFIIPVRLLYPCNNPSFNFRSNLSHTFSNCYNFNFYLPEIVTVKNSVATTVNNYNITVTLSPMFPDNYMLGLEIRVKVSDYVNDRIKALRVQHPEQYQNVAVLRTNAMKYLPNFFHKGQVTS